MDMEFKIFLMGIYIRDIIFKGSLMDLANILGPMALFIKEISRMVIEKGKEIGRVIMEINTLVISAMTEKMVLANIFGQMGTYTKETLVKIWERVRGKCFGVMVACIKENGNEDYLMEKVHITVIKLGTFKVKG